MSSRAVGRTAGALALTLVSWFVASGPARAGEAGARGEIRLRASLIEYRTLIRESLPESLVPGDGITRVLPDGRIVTCIPGGDCFYYRSGSTDRTTPFLQELHATGWPGWRGVSARLHVRGRLGSDAFWAESSRKVLLVEGSVDFQQTAYRLRAGRQAKTGGLGIYFFDGAAFLWKSFPHVLLEVWGGRSLARTLLEPRTASLLEDADTLPPDRPSTLWGVEGRWNPSRGFSAALLYQRELRTDRAGLYSERFAFDAFWAEKDVSVEGSADYDVAGDVVNDARMAVKVRPRTDLSLAARVRRSSPFFELWTIWGAFTPVGFSEERLTATWSVTPRVAVDVGLAYRNYEDTSTEADFVPIEGDGLRLDGGARWSWESWTLGTRAGVHRGHGAYRGTIDLETERRLGDRAFIGLFGSGTQQFAEFRFGEGTTRGAGLRLKAPIGPATLEGRIALYRHTFESQPGTNPYNQFRGLVSFAVPFGVVPARKPRASRQ